MRRLFQRLTSSQERSVSPDAEGSSPSNGTSSPSPVGVGGREELAGTAELGMGAMANFLPEFVLSVEFASDPSAWEAQLEKSWTRLDELLEVTAGRIGRDTLDKVFELLSTICHLLVMEVNSQSEPSIGPILDQFFNEEILLRVQRWAMRVPRSARPKCQMMLVRLYEYMLTSSQCPQSLLVHKPILTPLLHLLQWCRRSSVDEQRTAMTTDATTTASQKQQRRRPMATSVDRCFVRLINQICRKIAVDDTLLHFFFHSSLGTLRDCCWFGAEEEEGGIGCTEDASASAATISGDVQNGGGAFLARHQHQQPMDEGAAETTVGLQVQQHRERTDHDRDKEYFDDHPMTNGDEEKKPFLVFDLLVPYLYAPEDVGQLARDALLLIMSLSEQHQFVADYVAQKSNFCPVLTAGLSGCFSQLPHCIFTELGVSDADEFHKLSVMDAKTMPELGDFHNALLFCNAVVSVAHSSIVRQIVRFFYDGFLLEVFKSSVLESDAQELCSRVVYLHLCLDTVRTAPLVRALVKLLVAADTYRPDGCNLLEVLLSKMNTNDRLCRVTLSLLRTLLCLHCEDLLWCAVFRHLMPYIPLGRPRRPNQSRRFDINVSLDAAAFFLKSVPECTRPIAELYSEEQFEAYMREASDAIRDCALGCAGWRFKYDGVSPNIATLGSNNPSDELQSARQPFTRMCSARSSFASTGWNRYFQHRSAHGTLSAEGSTAAEAVQRLNELGKEEEDDDEEENNINRLAMDTAGGGGGTSSSQEEDFSDFNFCCSIAENGGDARLDYFQFAYEGVSESDDPDSAACSRRNSQESGEEEGGEKGRSALASAIRTNGGGGGAAAAVVGHNRPATSVAGAAAAVPSSSSAASPPFSSLSAPSPTSSSARSRVMDAIVATAWDTMNGSRDQFVEMLDALPLPSSDHGDQCEKVPPVPSATTTTTSCWSPVPKKARTVEENIALIESRWQYLEELRVERAERAKREGGNDNRNLLRLNLSEATAENRGQDDQQRQMDKAEEQQMVLDDDANSDNNENDGANRNNNNVEEEDGFPMECVEGMGAGILLDSLFEALSRLTEHTFATNLQLIGTFNAMLAYSQPLLTTYLLYVDALKSRALGRITNLLADLKEQIDAFARNGGSSACTPSSTIGDAAADFEQMVRRAVRHRQTRAERAERLLFHYQHHYHHHNQQQNGVGGGATPSSTTTSMAATSAWWSAAATRGHQQQPQQPSMSSGGSGGGATFRFTHRAMASAERGHLEEQERTRNFAYAAIAHSQLCLLMAAFALQHSAAVEYPRGGR